MNETQKSLICVVCIFVIWTLLLGLSFGFIYSYNGDPYPAKYLIIKYDEVWMFGVLTGILGCVLSWGFAKVFFQKETHQGNRINS